MRHSKWIIVLTSRTAQSSGVTTYMSRCSRRRSGVDGPRYAMQPVNLNGAPDFGGRGGGGRVWWGSRKRQESQCHHHTSIIIAKYEQSFYMSSVETIGEYSLLLRLFREHVLHSSFNNYLAASRALDRNAVPHLSGNPLFPR